MSLRIKTAEKNRAPDLDISRVHEIDAIEEEPDIFVNLGSVSLVLAPTVESVKGHIEKKKGLVELISL